MSDINIYVEIEVIGMPVVDEDTIGLYQGVFRWGDTGTRTDTLYGILSNKFLSTVTSAIDIRRGGTYAAINAASVSLNAYTGVQGWLHTRGFSLYGAKVTIKYDGSIGTGVLYTGAINKITDALDYLKIEVEPLSAGYAVEITDKATDTENRPAFLGTTDSFNYLKGVPVEQEIVDIGYSLAPLSYNKNQLYRVLKSSYDTVTITASNYLIQHSYLDAIADDINNNSTTKIPYLLGVLGNGTEVSIPVHSATVGIATGNKSTLELTLGYKDLNGDILDGSTNRLPDGLVGEELKVTNVYEPIANYPALEVSVVSLVYGGEYLAMDSWQSTKNGYLKEAYTYNDITKKFIAAPSYGSGYINLEDNIYSVSDVVSNPVEVEVVKTTAAGEDLHIALATNNDFFGIQDNTMIVAGLPHWNIFNGGITNGNSEGIFVDNVGGIAGTVTPVSVDPEEKLETILNKRATTGAYYYNGLCSGVKNLGFGFKIGMPDFSTVDGDVFLVGDISSWCNLTTEPSNVHRTRDVERCIYILCNDGSGATDSWSVIASQKSRPMTSYSTDAEGLLQNTYPPYGVRPTTDDYTYNYLLNKLDSGGFTADYRVTHKTSLKLDLTDVQKKSIKEMYLFIGLTPEESKEAAGSRLKEIHLEIDSIALVSEGGNNLEDTYFKYNNRTTSEADRTDLIDTSGELYEHILKLQKYKAIKEIPEPSKGWGLSYPNVSGAIWDSVIDSYITAKGLGGYQFTNSNGGSTKELKMAILHDAYHLGYTTRLGKEAYTVLDFTYGSPISNLAYTDFKGKPTFDKRSREDAFTEGVYYFRYNEGTGEYAASITISNLDKATFNTSYVIFKGWRDDFYANTFKGKAIWETCKKTYSYYNYIPPLVDKIARAGGVDNVDAALSYLFGLQANNGAAYNIVSKVASYLSRYTLRSTIGASKFIRDNLDIGSKVSIDIPTFTDGTHRGLITGYSFSYSDKASVTITVECRGDILTHITPECKIIDENGATTDYIKDDPTAPNTIIDTPCN